MSLRTPHGYDFYKDCIAKGIAKVERLGPALGPYHPLIRTNARRLKAVSRLDEAIIPWMALYNDLDSIWNTRVAKLNRRLADFALPVRSGTTTPSGRA